MPHLVLAVLFFLLWHGSAAGQTLALFPLLDLTVGTNGINPALTELVRREAGTLGYELVDDREIMQFLIRHRIRSMGRLTSHEISLAGEELDADLIMVGTVCQLEENPPTSVSMSLQMIRTVDASLVWAHTEGLYYKDLLSLLGLSDPKIMDDLYRVFFDRLFQDIPRITLAGKQQEEFLDVDTVVLQPEYARPGEPVECKIRLFSTLQDADNPPRIVARTGEEEYPLVLDEEGYYFTASWPAQDEEGEYAVILDITWPSGLGKSGIIGSYYIDSREPGVTLHVIGKELNDGRTAFSDRLVIVPRLIDPEPVSRWLIQVTSERGEVVVSQGAAENMPARLTWRGHTNQGLVASDGEYTIVFTVWDRVGRESAAEAKVLFLRMPPDISIEVNRANGEVAVDLVNTVTTPVAFWWMKFFDDTGSLLKLAEGDTLPAAIQVELPPPGAEEGDESVPDEDQEPVLEGLVQVVDIMGNQTTMKIKNLLLGTTEEEEEINLETEWVEEF